MSEFRSLLSLLFEYCNRKNNVLLRPNTMLNSITVTTSLFPSFRKRNEIGNYRNGIIPNKRNKPTGIINNTKHDIHFNTKSNDNHSP